jgi:DNA-binding NtrC family response regulator
LRLLQEREFLRIGSDDHVHVDIRFIGATSRLLEEMMQEGTFRRDLYYRLRAQQLRLPPLREREKDITFLWEHFTQIAAQQIGHGPPKFSKEAIEALMSWPFEGNVRELEGLAFQVVGCYKHFVDSKELLPLLSGEKIPQPQNLSESSDLFSFGSSLPQVDELIDHLIIEALRRSDGNQTQAAKMIGMSRRGMISRIQRHHLEA